MEEVRNLLETTYRFYVDSDEEFNEAFWSIQPISDALFRTLSSDEQNLISPEIFNLGHRITRDRVRRQHSGWTEGQIRAEAFRQTYRSDFSAEEQEKIAEQIRRFHDEN